MKRLRVATLALVALLVIAVGGAWLYVRSAEPDYDAGGVLPGLSAPVEVWRDSLGVPHVWARSTPDLYRALGYIHAQDRLWQMELFRRVADGRLAEALGADLVESDRFLRTVGMGRAAAENERLLAPEERMLLQAYADGVNAWVAAHSGALPPEFVILRIRPEPWTVRNSLSIAKAMAWDLADWNVGLDLQHAVDRLGPGLAADLFPEYPEWGTTILGPSAGTPTGASPGSTPAATTRSAAAGARPLGLPIPRIPDAAARLLDGASIARASNAWVIGGSRTRSGKPILANDTHLALRAPAIWYLAALHDARSSVAGMTIPGIPTVVIGHSRDVAWGFTNAMTDDVDFFVERLHPEDSSRYLAPDGWLRMAARPETIRVKGSEPVIHTVRSTRHGPVISGAEKRAGDRVLSARWTALDPSPEFRALLGMNRARNVDDFTAALHDFRNPHQNVVFADRHGRIGYWMAGRIPMRRSGTGLLPAPGWTDEHAWTGYLPFGEHPHALDPAEGFVVTANNRQIGAADYPHHISSHWADPYRAMRIREMVERGRNLTAAEVARQQMDVRDLHAVRHLPHAVRAADAAGDTAAVRILQRWDGTASTDSRAAPLYYAWYEGLRRRVGDDEFRGGTVYFPRATLDRMLDAGGGRWVDDVATPETETLGGLSAAAMRGAIAKVAGRSWGEVHLTEMEHPLGAVAALERVLELNVGPFASPGTPHTVNVAGYGGKEPPFTSRWGPSQRHVVDMADPDGEGGFVLPTGQSGVPSSPHYRDQTPLWRKGELWTIPLDREKAERKARHRAVLRPA